MTEFKLDQPVTVHIGGHDIAAEIRWVDDVSERVGVGYDAQTFTVPADWVVPVTPPCPWTEVGTLVQAESHGFLFRLTSDGWFSIGRNALVDYATDIAPYNPVRLVPENTCTCATNYANYEGPEADCVVHGAVRAFNKARREIDELNQIIEGLSKSAGVES